MPKITKLRRADKKIKDARKVLAERKEKDERVALTLDEIREAILKLIEDVALLDKQVAKLEKKL